MVSASSLKSNSRRKQAVDFFSTKDQSDSEDDNSVGTQSENEEEKSDSEKSNEESGDEVDGEKTEDDYDDDIEEEDNDDDDDKEEEEEEEASKSTAVKSKKVPSKDENDDDDDDFDYELEDNEEEDAAEESDKKAKLKQLKKEGSDNEESEDLYKPHVSSAPTTDIKTDAKPKKNKRKEIRKSLDPEAAAKRAKKSGLVYISRVPEFMTPIGMRQILSRYGPVDRLYLVPESEARRNERTKNSKSTFSSKQKIYVEGWAEFINKKHAKLAAEMLNGNTIGGKNRRSRFYDAVMSVKYLHKFKWNDLMEQMVVEKHSRINKLRTEIMQAHDQNRLFAQGVAMAHAMKRANSSNDNDGGESEHKDKKIRSNDLIRTFDQREIKDNDASKAKGSSIKKSANMESVLSKIF